MNYWSADYYGHGWISCVTVTSDFGMPPYMTVPILNWLCYLWLSGKACDTLSLVVGREL